MKIKFIALFITTLIILAYIAVRFLITDMPVNKIQIITNTGQIDKNLHAIIAENSQNLHKITALLQENLPYIDNAIIRKLPNGTVIIRVYYKTIVAAWKNQGFFFPLLENGEHMMTRLSQKESENYLVFVGSKPENAKHIIEILESYPRLRGQISSIEYIERRRFNLNLLDGRVIMLPEKDEANAVRQIRESGILSKTFMELDLRNQGRMLVTK